MIPGIKIVAVNDIMPADNLHYLIKYDSIYGPIQQDVSLKGNQLKTALKTTIVLREPEPLKLPWKQMDIDIVIESTGLFTTNEKAQQHIKAGAKQVILTTTGADDIPLLIYGYNQQQWTKKMNVISPGGCMTNCATHILNTLGVAKIEAAHIHIIHSYTSRQELVDTHHRQFRRGRAAAESIIPVVIDLRRALEKFIPQLGNKIAATSTRVPVPNGALADVTLQLKKPLTKKQVNDIFKAAAKKNQNIIAYTEDELVSVDIITNPHSAIIDSTLTSVIKNQVKVFAWFDNEYGYTSRIIDWLRFFTDKI